MKSTKTSTRLKKRGGARKGSGRKRRETSEKVTPMTIRCYLGTIQAFKGIVSKRGKTQREVFEAMVARELKG